MKSPRLLLTFPFLAVFPAFAAEGPVLFNRDIRPILSDKCFACHGFDAKKREADLRLDLPEAATAKNKDGEAAVVPGNVEASLLWQRIRTTDPDDVMPPPDTHKTVSPEEQELLRRWIAEGAVYQKHWAFEPVARVTGQGIDEFVSRRLAAQGLDFRPEADRRVLVRRVCLTLTGLPPSLEETEAFVRDTADGAYERMVERYLASPRYGEEMARHWLDIARYADTHGLHLDNERQMWPYRDWVVRSFNANEPFDQFTIDQLAGDLLPEPTQDQRIATGFNRCNVTTSEGGSIDAEFVFRYAVDRTSTVAQTWLGLTAGCAVCHDHKYDPLTQKEFYSLYAFFHSNADPAMDGNALLTNPVMKVKPPDFEEKMSAFAARIAAAETKLVEKSAAVSYADPAEISPRPAPVVSELVWFEDGFPGGAAAGASGHPLTLVETPVFSGKKALKRSGKGVAQDYYQAGGAPFTVPENAKFHVYVYVDPENPPREVMIQFHTGEWKHRALWGVDEIAFGTVGTTERFVAGPLPEAGQWVRLEVPAEKMGLSAGMAVTGYAFTVLDGTAYFDQLGVSGREDPAADPAQSFLAWRQAAAGKDTPDVPADLNGWLKAGPGESRTGAEMQRLREYYLREICRTTKAQFAAEIAARDAAKAEQSAYDASVPSTFVWSDLEKPRDSFVMVRGQYDKPGDKVEPGVPAVLPALAVEPGKRATRLDLARWLTAEENPLTARVTVNRFWQQMFGIGLVKSSHDFGTQGALPSHPELLDFLAMQFREGDWNVKRLVRDMLVSRAFRQESAAPEEIWQRDPENRFLARGPRFRLDAEQLRDQALYTGGLLVDEPGGKGVKPYQPPNIWEPVGFAGSNTRFYTQDTGKSLYRRSLYTFLKRTAPAPFMVNFDGPSREQTCPVRERSNTPLQALQLMNDVQHFEAARGLATRVLQAAAGSDAERIALAWRIVLARDPVAEESGAIVDFLASQRIRYAEKPEDAAKAIAFGESMADPALPAPELAAWTLVANLLLNLDETINRN